MKADKLKFEPCSVDRSGHYRWFQSHHKEVNDIIESFLKTANVTLSKTAWREMVVSIETNLNLEPTPEP